MLRVVGFIHGVKPRGIRLVPLVNPDLLEAAANLELFACVFAGTDHVPVDALAARGVSVTNAAGIHAPGIAEQSVGSMLVFARRLHEAWRRKETPEWRQLQPAAFTGSTVTVVGLGAIGQAITRQLAGFGVDTIGIRYTPSKGGPTDVVYGFEQDAIHRALSRSDYVVVACPLTDTVGYSRVKYFDTPGVSKIFT